MERNHENDIRKLWIRIAALTVLIAVLTKNEGILGTLLEVVGL